MTLEFSQIPNTLEAAKFICELRNDPYICEMSNQPFKRELNSFYHGEFIDRYVTTSSNLSYFICYEGKKIGVFALERTKEPTDSTREVSIFLSQQYRFRGFGKKALTNGIAFAKRLGINKLEATIKEENEPSKKLFLSCGFEKKEKWQLSLFPSGKVQVIAEAGSNFKGKEEKQDLERAFLMIHAAKNAGADFVKFQLFTPKKMYSENAGEAKYLNEIVSLSMDGLYEKYQLPRDFLPKLKQKCDEVGIGFLASSFSEEDFLALDPFVQVHKIASYEITHTKLITLAARSKKPLLLSTGGASLEEIENAVTLFQKEGGEKLTLLQCTAQYPADPEAMNISALEQLKTRFGVSVGLSDHSKDPITAPVMAVTLGAIVIEKHFTLDRSEKGPDHFFALEPEELKQMIQAIRLAEKMKLSADKGILPQEKELADFAKRGLQAIQNIKKGQKFVFQENIDILRPGNNLLGIHPKHLEKMEGKLALKDVEAGQGITLGDVEW